MTYIVGSGALGSLWAAHLQSGGAQVEFLASENYLSRKSQDRLRKYSKPGVKKSKQFDFQSFGSDNTKTVSIPLYPILKSEHLEPNRIILLCTKSYVALESALELKPRLKGSALVLFQNGYGVHSDIAEQLDQTAVYAATTTEGANLTKNSDDAALDLLKHAGTGITTLGPLNKMATERGCEPIAKQLALSALKIDIVENIDYHLVKKLIINCAINPFTALLECHNGEIIHQDFYKELWPKLKQELFQFCQLKEMDVTIEQLELWASSVIEATAMNKSSMFQDRINQRRTEIEHINGIVYKTLKMAGLSHTANQILYESVLSLHP